MNIALCICTRNRPDDVSKALSSVFRSFMIPAQVIVSDDSDEDLAIQTSAVCAAFPGVTYLLGPRKGLSTNRNRCLHHLEPTIEAVAYIDDDVIIRPSFIGDAAKALASSPPKTIVTGRENKNGLDITPHNCSFWGHQEVPPRNESDYHTIVINAALFPKTLFKHACFDDALQYGYEESDICAQAESLGYRIRFFSDIVNDHYPSLVNRTEYARVVEASRLYTTYKRYKWLERKRFKAFMYAGLAPIHMVSANVKTGQLKNISNAFTAMSIAYQYTRMASQSEKLLS